MMPTRVQPWRSGKSATSGSSLMSSSSSATRAEEDSWCGGTDSRTSPATGGRALQCGVRRASWRIHRTRPGAISVPATVGKNPAPTPEVLVSPYPAPTPATARPPARAAEATVHSSATGALRVCIFVVRLSAAKWRICGSQVSAEASLATLHRIACSWRVSSITGLPAGVSKESHLEFQSSSGQQRGPAQRFRGARHERAARGPDARHYRRGGRGPGQDPRVNRRAAGPEAWATGATRSCGPTCARDEEPTDSSRSIMRGNPGTTSPLSSPTKSGR